MRNLGLVEGCSPPEELVMPRTFPRAPTPYLAAILAPLSWQFGRPDLFDSYSAGVTLLQMASVFPFPFPRGLCNV